MVRLCPWHIVMLIVMSPLIALPEVDETLAIPEGATEQGPEQTQLQIGVGETEATTDTEGAAVIPQNTEGAEVIPQNTNDATDMQQDPDARPSRGLASVEEPQVVFWKPPTRSSKNPTLRVGPVLGMSSSSTSISSAYTPLAATGVVVGASSEIDITDSIAFSPEILYVPMGYVFFQGVTAYMANYRVIRIPWLIKIKQGSDDQKLRFNVIAGPSVGFRVSPLQLMQNDVSIDSTEQPASVFFAVELGAGVELRISQQLTVYINLRYVIGLTSSPAPIINEAINHRDLQSLAGMMFGF